MDGEGRICATFEDGEHRAFDLEPMLSLPVFRPLANLAERAKVTVIDDGCAVAWPSGTDLYGGAIYDRGEPILATNLEQEAA